MKNLIRLIQLTALALIANVTTAQHMTLAGSQILIPPGSSINVKGNLEIKGPVILDNNGEITVGGNWINTAPADFSLEGTSGKVIFNGETPQIITGNFNTTFSNLHLQNHAALDIEVMITETLELEDALLTLNKMDLALLPGAEIQGAGPMAYVAAHGDGRLIQPVGSDEVFFPVGTNTSYLPAQLSNSGTPDAFGINMFPNVRTGGLSGGAIAEIAHAVANTWVIAEETPGGSDLTITLWWNLENEGALFDRSQSGIGHFKNGEWDAQEAETAAGADPYSLTRTAITQMGAFAVGDINSPLAFAGILEEQVINLSEGWSGWSSFISPQDNDYAAVVAPVSDDLIISTHFHQVFYPAFNINTIGQFSNQHGYVVKMAGEKALFIEGTMANQTITLNSGWNILPVISACNVDADELLSDLSGLIIAFEVAGNGMYYPELNINTLQTLAPGKAYFIKMQTLAELTFPSCTKNVVYAETSPFRPKNNTPWNEPAYSGSSHIVIFDQNATVAFQPGDMIGAFTADGLCAGLTLVTETTTSMALFGNDQTTASRDGFEEYEPLTFKLYRGSNGNEYSLDVSYSALAPESNGVFVNNGLSIVGSVTMSLTGVQSNEMQQLTIYPNPSSGQFFIANFSGEGDIAYEVMDSRGLVIFRDQLSHDGIIDLTGQPKGLYFLRIGNEKYNLIEKLIVW